MKREIRILALDDAALSKKSKNVPVIGLVYRGGSYPDGFLMFSVTKDGSDATKNFLNVLGKSIHRKQLQYILLKGITLAGFNYLDIEEIYKHIKIPVIVVMRKKPDMNRFLKAFRKINPKARKIVKSSGKIQKLIIKGKPLYIQKSGISQKEVKELLDITCLHADIPEPLRVASIIAEGLRIL